MGVSHRVRLFGLSVLGGVLAGGAVVLFLHWRRAAAAQSEIVLVEGAFDGRAPAAR